MEEDDPRDESLPAELLGRFLRSGRSESAFAELVRRLGGLVYHRALRGTGDHGLAEEVAQNVFAILARKAERLENHDCLSAWVLQTTKLEAAKAMRKTYSRRRAHRRLAEQIDGIHAPEPPEHEASHRLDELLDRLPESDRRLIISRFYEGQKFSQIASRTGKSEAACKMQLKRVLGRLSGWLSAGGTALSVTSVAAVLTSNAAEAAPAGFVTTVASKALAASSSVTTGTLITNTIHTMSTLKQAGATVALVAALTAIPSTWHLAQAHTLREEQSRLTLELASYNQPTALSSRDARTERRKRLSVRSLVGDPNQEIRFEDFMNSLQEGLMTQDMMLVISTLMPVSRMPEDRIRELMAQLADYQGDPEIKGAASMMFSSFLSEDDTGSTLNAALASGMPPRDFGRQLGKWAESDPEAAIAWFLEHRNAGAFQGKGTEADGSTEAQVLSRLLESVAKTDPASALKLFAAEGVGLAGGECGRALATSMAQTAEGRQMLTDYLAGVDDESLVRTLLGGAISRFPQSLTFSDAEAFAEGYDLSQESREELAFVTACHEGLWSGRSRQDQVDWLLSRIDPSRANQALERLVGSHYGGDGNWDEWIQTQEPGDLRDAALSGRVTSLIRGGMSEEGLDAALSITAAPLRDAVIRETIRRWDGADFGPARKAIEAANLNPGDYGL